MRLGTVIVTNFDDFARCEAARHVLFDHGMKTLEGLALALTLAFTIATAAGCSHDAPAKTTPTSPVATSTEMSATADTDPMVDPTLPSWAPKACAAYHAAVVRMVGCPAVDAAKRETARQAYDTTSKSWHDMHDLPEGAIDGVRMACVTQTQLVKADTDPTCPATTNKPPVEATR